MAGANSATQIASQRPGLHRLLVLFGDSLDIVERRYVTPVDTKPALEAAIKGMVTSLDPHSDYLTPGEYDDIHNANDLASVGLMLTSENGVVRVVTPIDGGPAAVAGVRAGDRIVAIDGHTPMGARLADAIRSLKGPAGSSVALTIKRPAQDAFDLKLVRQIVPSVTAKGHMEGDYGYLRISALDMSTAAQAADAIRALKATNPRMKGLVLDLRDNPGGLLSTAVEVSCLFLDGGEVVSQQGRDPADIEHYNARPDGDMLRGLPVVVLINGATASGAEIVAAALKDRHRATVVGLTSFGMGTIQTLIPLDAGHGGAIKLTTSRIFSPSGQSFQVVGVSPDIEVAASAKEAERASNPAYAFSEANMLNAIDVRDGEARRTAGHRVAGPPDGFDPKGDYQLARALQALGAGASVQASR